MYYNYMYMYMYMHMFPIYEHIQSMTECMMLQFLRKMLTCVYMYKHVYMYSTAVVEIQFQRLIALESC